MLGPGIYVAANVRYIRTRPCNAGATVRLRVLRRGGLYRPGEHRRAGITSGDVRRVRARLSASGRGRSPGDKAACRVALHAKG